MPYHSQLQAKSIHLLHQQMVRSLESLFAAEAYILSPSLTFSPPLPLNGYDALFHFGGITAIVKAMTTHKEDLLVQNAGIAVLGAFCGNQPEDKYAIIEDPRTSKNSSQGRVLIVSEQQRRCINLGRMKRAAR
jgi:hypothetical protein